MISCTGSGSFGGGMIGGGSKNPGNQLPDSDFDVVTNSAEKNADGDIGEKEFEKIANKDTSKFFEDVLSNIEPGSVEVGGRIFETVYDKVLECQSYIFDLSANFSTLGELFESAEVYSAADIHFDDYENSLDVMEKAHERGPTFFKKKSLDSDKLDDMASKNGGSGSKLRLRDRLHLEIDAFDCDRASESAACCSSVSAAICGQQPRYCALHTKVCMVMSIKAKKACEDKSNEDVDDGSNNESEEGM